MQRYGASQTQACAVLRISRSVYSYRSRARGARALRQRIKEIAATRVHYGYRRVHVLLQREGWKYDCKRVYRLYRAEGLSLRHCRPRRNKSARLRQPKQLVREINEVWSMDFVADALFDGRRLRALTVVDNYTRECLAIEVGQSLKRDDVVGTLLHITAIRGRPQTIKVDNVLNASCTSLRSNSHPGRRGDPRRLGETASTTTNQWSSAVVQGSLA